MQNNAKKMKFTHNSRNNANQEKKKSKPGKIFSLSSGSTGQMEWFHKYEFKQPDAVQNLKMEFHKTPAIN